MNINSSSSCQDDNTFTDNLFQSTSLIQPCSSNLTALITWRTINLLILLFVLILEIRSWFENSSKSTSYILLSQRRLGNDKNARRFPVIPVIALCILSVTITRSVFIIKYRVDFESGITLCLFLLETFFYVIVSFMIFRTLQITASKFKPLINRKISSSSTPSSPNRKRLRLKAFTAPRVEKNVNTGRKITYLIPNFYIRIFRFILIFSLFISGLGLMAFIGLPFHYQNRMNLIAFYLFLICLIWQLSCFGLVLQIELTLRHCERIAVRTSGAQITNMLTLKKTFRRNQFFLTFHIFHQTCFFILCICGIRPWYVVFLFEGIRNFEILILVVYYFVQMKRKQSKKKTERIQQQIFFQSNQNVIPSHQILEGNNKGLTREETNLTWVTMPEDSIHPHEDKAAFKL